MVCMDPLAWYTPDEDVAVLAGASGRRGRLLGVGRHHADGTPPAPPAEFDLACHQGEQCVVATTADAYSRVEVRAVLAHYDLSGVDELAAKPLHAEPLRV
jgi:hypothetical protein